MREFGIPAFIKLIYMTHLNTAKTPQGKYLLENETLFFLGLEQGHDVYFTVVKRTRYRQFTTATTTAEPRACFLKL